MEIKGTALKATKKYIQNNYPGQYNVFLKHLPPQSREFYENPILANQWYPLKEGILTPTEIIGELFFDNNKEKGAFEVGIDSAIQALKGIYKIFVRITSLEFVIKRTETIFSTYYSQGNMALIENKENLKRFRVTGFSEAEQLIFYRISGWIFGIFDVISENIDSVTHTVEKDGDLVVAYINLKLS